MLLLKKKAALSDGEGTAKSSSLQPLWKAMTKDMASFLQLQRTDIKKHKEAKTKNPRIGLATTVYAYIYIFIFLSRFVFSYLPYYANLTKIRVRPGGTGGHSGAVPPPKWLLVLPQTKIVPPQARTLPRSN